MDMRNNMPMHDGRNPYGSRGGYVSSRRARRSGRRDRGMYPMYDMNYNSGHSGSRMGRDYNYDMASSQDMRGMGYNNYNHNQDMRSGYDGHYPQGQGSTYYPIQAMGTFEGYYGMPNQDYGMNNRRDYGYDMRGRYDYGYNYGGDYGENLTEEELKKWCEKLKHNLSEQEKQMFSKESIAQRVKSMNKEMKDFGEKELEVVTLMLLDDYKKTLGTNPELMIKLAFDWLDDKDAKLKGAEKLAVYHDEIVMGGEDD